MKKIYLLLFFSLIASFTVSAKILSPLIVNDNKFVKVDFEKEKVDTFDDENQETGNLKTTEFILTLFSCVIFLKRVKIKFPNKNNFLPTTYFNVPKQPPKSLYFSE